MHKNLPEWRRTQDRAAQAIQAKETGTGAALSGGACAEERPSTSDLPCRAASREVAGRPGPLEIEPADAAITVEDLASEIG